MLGLPGRLVAAIATVGLTVAALVTVLRIVQDGNAASVVRVAAAGDIACSPEEEASARARGTESRCMAGAVSDAVLRWSPGVVLALGDIQYEKGELENFRSSYDRTWGRLKQVTRPVVGNHEYLTADAAGYFAYFGTAAGPSDKGYYSFDTGSWHVVVLNSNCRRVGGCDLSSPQVRWLQEDLRTHRDRCTLAALHHPRFSSGKHGSEDQYATLWRVLQDAGVEIVLAGHDHVYERLAPQDAEGRADPRGPRQFVVGTGGRNHTEFRTPLPTSEARSEDAFGFLGLELTDSAYRWRFHAVAGSTFVDEGERRCS